jgi:hypothetical protein
MTSVLTSRLAIRITWVERRHRPSQPATDSLHLPAKDSSGLGRPGFLSRYTFAADGSKEPSHAVSHSPLGEAPPLRDLQRPEALVA